MSVYASAAELILSLRIFHRKLEESQRAEYVVSYAVAELGLDVLIGQHWMRIAREMEDAVDKLLHDKQKLVSDESHDHSIAASESDSSAG